MTFYFAAVHLITGHRIVSVEWHKNRTAVYTNFVYLS